MKKFKVIAAVVMIACMGMSVAACSGVKEIEDKEFKDAVKEVLDCDKEDLDIYEGKDETYVDYIETEIFYSGDDADKYDVSYTEYEDEEAARYAFDSYVTSVKFYKDHDGIDGKVKIAKNYVTYDAEITPSYDGKGVDAYGGRYVAGPYIIDVECTTGKDKDKDVIDDLLKELGLPRPSRA